VSRYAIQIRDTDDDSAGVLTAGYRASRRRSIRIWYKFRMHLDAANPLLPIATLAAGVFLMIAPRVVSFTVAVYLIVVGMFGLNGIYHFIK
jgi:Protein of unknown function (DUF3096)